MLLVGNGVHGVMRSNTDFNIEPALRVIGANRHPIHRLPVLLGKSNRHRIADPVFHQLQHASKQDGERGRLVIGNLVKRHSCQLGTQRLGKPGPTAGPHRCRIDLRRFHQGRENAKGFLKVTAIAGQLNREEPLVTPRLQRMGLANFQFKRLGRAILVVFATHKPIDLVGRIAGTPGAMPLGRQHRVQPRHHAFQWS